MRGTFLPLFHMFTHRTHIAAISAALLLGACSLSFGSKTGAPQTPVNSNGPSPQTIIQDMTKTMRDQKSLALKGSIGLTVDDKQTGENLKLNFGIDGKADARTEGDERFTFNIKSDVSGKMQQTSLTGSIDADATLFQKDLFTRLNSLVLPPEAAQFEPIVQELKGKWYIFADALSKTKDLAKSEGGSVAQLADLFAAENATPEQKAATEKLVEERFADIFDKTLGENVKLGGVETTKISIKLNRPQLVSFIKEMAEINKAPMSSNDISELEKGLKEVEFEGAFYIGVTDKNLYKFEGTFAPATGSDLIKQGNFTVSAKLEMTGFGENQDITKPLGAEVLDQAKLFGLMAPPTDPTDPTVPTEGLDLPLETGATTIPVPVGGYDGGSVE